MRPQIIRVCFGPARFLLLLECYFPLDPGDYRVISVDDFQLIAQTLNRSFLVLDVDELKAHHLRPGLSAQILSVDAGLRYLRSFPGVTGIMILNCTYSLLETAWRLDNKKELPRSIETDLVLGLLKGRGKRHVAFW